MFWHLQSFVFTSCPLRTVSLFLFPCFRWTFAFNRHLKAIAKNILCHWNKHETVNTQTKWIFFLLLNIMMEDRSEGQSWEKIWFCWGRSFMSPPPPASAPLLEEPAPSPDSWWDLRTDTHTERTICHQLRPGPGTCQSRSGASHDNNNETRKWFTCDSQNMEINRREASSPS